MVAARLILLVFHGTASTVASFHCKLSIVQLLLDLSVVLSLVAALHIVVVALHIVAVAVVVAVVALCIVVAVVVEFRIVGVVGRNDVGRIVAVAVAVVAVVDKLTVVVALAWD